MERRRLNRNEGDKNTPTAKLKGRYKEKNGKRKSGEGVKGKLKTEKTEREMKERKERH